MIKIGVVNPRLSSEVVFDGNTTVDVLDAILVNEEYKAYANASTRLMIDFFSKMTRARFSSGVKVDPVLEGIIALRVA